MGLGTGQVRRVGFLNALPGISKALGSIGEAVGASQQKARQNDQQEQLRSLFTGEQPPTQQQIETQVGQINPNQGIKLAQQRIQEQGKQTATKQKFYTDMASQLVKTGNTKALDVVGKFIADNDPEMGKFLSTLAGQKINIGGKGYTVKVDSNNKFVRFDRGSGKFSTAPSEETGGPVFAKETKFSNRPQNIKVDRNMNPLTPEQIKTMSSDDIFIGKGHKDQETGKWVVTAISGTETAQKKADIGVSSADKKLRDKDDLRREIDTEQVIETNNLIAGQMARLKDIYKELPDGLLGRGELAFKTAATRLNMGEFEKLALKEEIETIKTTVANFARSIGGQKGVLSDLDITMALKAFPDWWKSESEQMGALQGVQNELNRRMEQNGIKNKIDNYERFYLNFTDDPAGFVNEIVAEPKGELDFVSGQTKGLLSPEQSKIKSQLNPGQIIIKLNDGRVGVIEENQFDSNTMRRL